MNKALNVITAVVFLVLSSHSNAGLIFDFSFSNSGGNTPGTVTGRIFGLVDNVDGQAATSVLIDSYPAGLLGTLGAPDVTTWSSQVANSFNVSSGAITGGGIAAQNIAFFDTFILGPVAASPGGLNNFLSLDNGDTFTGNSGGFEGASYSQNAVPAPGTLALLGLGLLGLRLRRRA